jgi:radical SAM protein (TIGR01212 family)
MSIETSWFEQYPHHTFNAYAHYLRKRYNQPAYRVSVDGGFSCPHRGEDRSHPGCTYCDEYGSRAPYLGNSVEIEKQITGAIEFLKTRYGAGLYLLYFQAFSSTFAPVKKCKELYDRALSCAPFRELIISTRPDCINSDIAELLCSYRDIGIKVCVELGLQSASDTTLQRIRRGHTVETFRVAYNHLKEKGIAITVHLIFGLPGEGIDDMLNTVSFVSDLKPDGIKIHNLHIPLGTHLFREFLTGEIVIPSPERHLDYVIQALELLPPQTIIMRLTCDTPPQRLAFPRHFWDKAQFYEAVRKEMRRRNTWQGRYYKKH